jgi:uncharacterized protein involved in exopolysaccharide biosynthesis
MGLDVLNKGHNRTLGDIVALLWAAKLYILGFLLVLCALCALWLMGQPNYYRASMLIGPVEPLFSAADKALYEAQDAQSSTPLYQMKRRDSTIEFQQFLKTMRGESVAKAVIANAQGVLPYFETEQDKVFPWSKRYGFDGAYSEALQLSAILKDRVNIQPDGLTPFYQVSILMRERALAPQLLAALYDLSDHQLRGQAMKTVTGRIAYLKQRMDAERSRDYRKLLASLILQEEYSLMALQAEGAFAAQIIEQPHVSPYVVWPKPFIVMFAAALISFMLGSILYSYVAGIKQRKA